MLTIMLPSEIGRQSTGPRRQVAGLCVTGPLIGLRYLATTAQRAGQGVQQPASAQHTVAAP